MQGGGNGRLLTGVSGMAHLGFFSEISFLSLSREWIKKFS